MKDDIDATVELSVQKKNFSNRSCRQRTAQTVQTLTCDSIYSLTRLPERALEHVKVAELEELAGTAAKQICRSEQYSQHAELTLSRLAAALAARKEGVVFACRHSVLLRGFEETSIVEK